MSQVRLFCEHEKNPIGIDTKRPLFSWYVQSEKRNLGQVAYILRVAETKEDLMGGRNLLWEYISNSEEMNIIYKGQYLISEESYYWNLKVTLNDGEQIESDIAKFETSFLDMDCWKAKWISLPKSRKIPDRPPLDEEGNAMPIQLEEIPMTPAYQVRRDFSIEKKVRRAQIYVTSHGIYQVLIDGKRVGANELAPEHTQYRVQLLYQRYEVEDYLTVGVHTIGILLADGWYSGRIGFAGDDCQYGNTLAVLLQMQIEYEDGSKDWIGTDDKFQYSISAYAYADLFVGEKYDARLFNKDFFLPGFQGEGLLNTKVLNEGYGNLKAQASNHIKVIEEITAVDIWEEYGDAVVVDFGVVIAGKFRTILCGKSGQEVRFECSEILDNTGKFIKNIQESYKNQTDIYICSGEKEEVYEPMFTYHGFRYIKVTGLKNKNEMKEIKALVLSSEMKKTGEFSCSDDRLNQLQKNIFRSQLSNMISIPTDCPQREKIGWTGDVQIFAATACFNQDMRTFFYRWLADMRAEQLEDGQIPIAVPYLGGYKREFEGITSSAGWSDTAVILPWILYCYYGDRSVLEDNYDMMEKWVRYIQHTAETKNPEELENCKGERVEHLRYIWNTGFHFGDWLTPSVSINLETGTVDMMQSAILTMDIVPTLFFFYSTILLSKISKILYKKEKQYFYEKLADKIKEAFCYEYVDEQGDIKSELQGIYVLSLQFGILKPDMEKKARKRLAELIQKNHGKLDTGFMSVPYILDVLKNSNESTLMYQMLFSEECPSWLYEIKMGATSIWESWQAVLPDGRSSSLSMNHYSFGCVGDWMYRNLAGIQMLEPGYKKIRFAPDLCAPLEWVKGKYISIYGDIRCEWEKKGVDIIVAVEVPVNTAAEIVLDNVEEVRLDDVPAEGFTLCREMKKAFVCVSSGMYKLKVRLCS